MYNSKTEIFRRQPMKLLLDIKDTYVEPEIHICCDSAAQAMCLREVLDGVVNTRIAVQKDQKSRTLATYEIVRIYSETKRVFLRTLNDTYEVRERLYVLEERLDDRDFVRISNSELVNISQIEKLDMSYIGTIKMYMKNGDETFVSRRYVSRIKEKLL